MSVEKYFGTITSTTFANYVDRLREAVGLLVRHAPVTIDTTITDTDDEYAVILNVGSDRYAKVRVASKSSTHDVQVEFSTGYKDGEYVPLRNITYGYTPSTVENIPTEIVIINNGDVWELDYQIVTSARYTYILRGSQIVSSIDGAEYCSSGVVRVNTGSQSQVQAADYPLIDGLMFRYEDYEPQEYMLSCSDPDTAHNNVGEGKLMLFPSLLCAPGPFQTGAAMVGNQSTYFMSCRPTDPIPRYEEFVLNRQKFVSLGRLAIRSR